MPVPLRWRLTDQITGETVVECMDIDGIFADRVFPVEPQYEQYTLLSCAPAGDLLAAIHGSGTDWFGNFLLHGAHAPGRPMGEGCDLGQCRECYEIAEEVLDVRVVGHRPAADGSGLLDIVLEGHRHGGPNNSGGSIAPAVAGYRLMSWSGTHGSEAGVPAGVCRGVAGLFRERAEVWPAGPPVTLRGCLPGFPESFEAEPAHVRVDGTAHRAGWGLRVFGTVTAARESSLGGGLVDLVLNAGVPEPLAANERPLWDMWHAGGPTELNSWAKLERSDRYLWVQAAAVHRIPAPDKPADTVYHLDGRYITDYDGFFCAIGEAVNGPGGWFGGSLFWLHENAATGNGGAAPGFQLIWHDSEIARMHLVSGYDRKSWQPAVTFDDIVGCLRDSGVQLDLN